MNRSLQPAPSNFSQSILYKVFDLFALWDKSSLKSRLTFVQTFILIVSIAAILFSGIALYRTDKISYVHEVHYQKTRSISYRLKLVFASLPRQSTFNLKASEETKFAESYKMPQMPGDDQFFVGRKDEKIYVFGRVLGEKFWRAELRSDVPLFEGIDGKSYIANNFGEFISSYNLSDVNASNFITRPGTDKFLKSGLKEGFTRSTDGDTDWIVSFREVEGTNVFAFVETSLASLNAPILKFRLYAIVMALVLVGLVILVTDFLLLGLLRPLREIVNAMFKVSAGHYDIQFNVKFDEELNFVARGLQQMAKRLQIREGELMQISGNLEFVMKLTKEMSLAADRDACLQLFIRQVRGYVKFKTTMDASAVVYESDGKKPKGVVEYVSKGKVVEEIKMVSIASSAVDMDALVSDELVSMLDRTVVLRAFAGDELKMILMLDGFPEEMLSTIERHLMSLLSSSLGSALVMFEFQEKRLETAHFENELVIAQTVQQSLLPSARPIMNADLQFTYEAATRCGGDWLFFDKSEESPWLHALVGDVTGHGVPAAIMTGVAYGSFMGAQSVMETMRASETMGETDRLEFMAAILNRAILSVGKSARLMTMCLVSLDTDTGELYYASAGHTPLLWFKAKSKKISPQTSTGNPLGVSLDRTTTVKKLQLEQGDLFALYTDGLLENHGPKNEMLHKRRFYEILSSGRPVSEIMNQIMGEAKTAWGDEEYADDVTMLIVRWPASEDTLIHANSGADALPAASGVPPPPTAA